MSGDSSGVSRLTIVNVGVFVVIALLVGSQVALAATSDDAKAYVEDSEEWCNDRDGRLVNVNAIWHGGLHCELENGTSVHMREVIDT